MSMMRQLSLIDSQLIEYLYVNLYHSTISSTQGATGLFEKNDHRYWYLYA